MSIGSRIKEARVRIGITQEQLANLINVSKGAIGNYENDTNYPKTEVIFDLCRVLKCDANYLYQDDVASVSDFCVSYPEQGFLRKYRSLDEHGKATVDAVLVLEYKRCQSELENTQEIVHYLSIPVYDDPAAAGSPSDNSSDYEYIRFLAENVPEGTDFGVRISGDSMEPTIPNGSIAFVERKLDLDDDDIGIFQLRDGAVCKRLSCTENSRVKSLNSDNMRRESYSGSELDGMRVVGKVLGCTKEWE